MTNNNAIDTTVIETLKEIMGDDFSVIIDTFTDDTGKLVNSLAALQKENNVEVFTRNAHSIKSSSANLGALQTSALAAELETRGKTGDISNLEDTIHKLNAEFDNACKALAEIN